MRVICRCLFYTLAIALTGAASSALPAAAGTVEFTVSRTDDPTPNGCLPDDCSLREAIIAGNATSNAVIHLPGGTYTLSRGGKLENAAMTGDLDISADVAIAGAGRGVTTVDANGIDRVVQVTAGAVAISGLTITGGAIELNDGEASSGGLLNMGNTTLSNVAVSGNTTWGDGGGIDNGGTLTIRDSVISGNTSDSAAGGIENGGTLTIERSRIEGNEAFVAGGIDNYAGTLTLTDSTVSSNVASGGFGGGGGIQNGGNAALAITGSTIADNSADADGAGLKVRDSSTASIANSTFSGNDASGDGGGIAVFDSASVNITNVTIADNSADAGGGVINDESGQQLTIKNSVLHGNSAPFGAECAGEVASLGHNVIGPIDGCILLSGVTFAAGSGADGDIFADPNLGPLQDNGGPTATYAIADNSPAFDAGDNAGCPATDQRGITRPQGAACDIGAFELEVAVETGLFGDVDCDEDVDSVDSLKILRHVAQLGVIQEPGCPEIGSEVASLFGDVGCDDDVDAVDALFILRYVAFLPVSQPQGCREIGT